MHIAAIQLEVSDGSDKAARLKKVDDILSRIHEQAQRPDIIMLPEIWGCGFFGFDNYLKESEPLDGSTFQLLSSWAVRLGAYILGGSIVEAGANGFYNTSLLINREGKLEGCYRKMHLFGYQSEEQKLLSRGEAPVVIKTDLGTIGLSTCYDLRFPEQYRSMVDQGAELFLVVSAWPEARLNHWRLFNQVRALENQCWLVSCNCSGTQNGSRYAGHSMTVSPSGEIIAEADADSEVLHSHIDLSQVKEYRKTFPALADRLSMG